MSACPSPAFAIIIVSQSPSSLASALDWYHSIIGSFQFVVTVFARKEQLPSECKSMDLRLGLQFRFSDSSLCSSKDRYRIRSNSSRLFGRALQLLDCTNQSATHRCIGLHRCIHTYVHTCLLTSTYATTCMYAHTGEVSGKNVKWEMSGRNVPGENVPDLIYIKLEI